MIKIYFYMYIQRVSKISALILISDKSRQKQQNCYNFSKYNLISVFYFIVI
jgi:hypothetical protein